MISDRPGTSQPPASAGKHSCPRCGDENYATDAVCFGCGLMLQPVWLPSSDTEQTTGSPVGAGRPGWSTVGGVLALGFLSLPLIRFWGLGFLLGVLAWILGNRLLARLNENGSQDALRVGIHVGRACGMVSTVLLALWVSLALPRIMWGGLGGPEVKENQAAPEVRLYDLGGREHTLGAYRGRILLINFFASW